MKKRGGGKSRAKLKTEVAEPLDDVVSEKLKNIVMKRHREWRAPRKHNYGFYLVILVLIIAGIYLMTEPGIRLSEFAVRTTFVLTMFLTIAFLVLIKHHLKVTSNEGMEEMIENEINRFRFEKPSRR